MSPVASDESRAPDGTPERHARYDVHLDAEQHVRWRLIAPNGRVLARSARGHVTAGACRIELDRLRRRVVDLVPVIGRATGAPGWFWSVALEPSAPVALSARTYERLESCQVSYERFVRLLTVTEPDDW